MGINARTVMQMIPRGFPLVAAFAFLSACAAAPSANNTDTVSDMLADCIAAEFTVALVAAVADVDADADADGLIDGVFAECDFLYTVLEEFLMLDGQTVETAATVVAESKVTAREELILALTGTPE